MDAARGRLGFLRGIGFADIKRISGRLAAMLMKVEPQMGFVIFEAMQRQGITATDQAGLAPAQELRGAAFQPHKRKTAPPDGRGCFL